VLCLGCCSFPFICHNRQHREVADVEMSRLSSQLEAARAAAAAASGQAGQAEAAANAKLEAMLRKQVQVWPDCNAAIAVIMLCRDPLHDILMWRFLCMTDSSCG
jgi:SpoU rRNA methylase family enzyme